MASWLETLDDDWAWDDQKPKSINQPHTQKLVTSTIRRDPENSKPNSAPFKSLIPRLVSQKPKLKALPTAANEPNGPSCAPPSGGATTDSGSADERVTVVGESCPDLDHSLDRSDSGTSDSSTLRGTVQKLGSGIGTGAPTGILFDRSKGDLFSPMGLESLFKPLPNAHPVSNDVVEACKSANTSNVGAADSASEVPKVIVAAGSIEQEASSSVKSAHDSFDLSLSDATAPSDPVDESRLIYIDATSQASSIRQLHIRSSPPYFPTAKLNISPDVLSSSLYEESVTSSAPGETDEGNSSYNLPIYDQTSSVGRLNPFVSDDASSSQSRLEIMSGYSSIKSATLLRQAPTASSPGAQTAGKRHHSDRKNQENNGISPIPRHYASSGKLIQKYPETHVGWIICWPCSTLGTDETAGDT
ncbi:hypothetical protein ABW19_dt0203809 [Dactylella cylindrospora]|nr:hypothetical protein ABW19_dt0203809 [Dactylella cylindrospora]